MCFPPRHGDSARCLFSASLGIYERDWYRAGKGLYDSARAARKPLPQRAYNAGVRAIVVALNVLAAIPLVIFAGMMAVAGVVFVAGKYHVLVTPVATRPPDASFWAMVSLWHLRWTDLASQQDRSGLYSGFLFYNSHVIPAVAAAFLIPMMSWHIIRALRAPRLLITLVAIVAAAAWAVRIFDWTTTLSAWAITLPPAIVVGYNAMISGDRGKSLVYSASLEPIVAAIFAGICWGLYGVGANSLGAYIGLDLRIVAVAFAAAGVVSLVLLPGTLFFQPPLQHEDQP